MRFRLRVPLATLGCAALIAQVGTAQEPAVRGYTFDDVQWRYLFLEPAIEFGFDFRPTDDLRLLGLSFFNPDSTGGADALGGEHDGRPLPTSYRAVLYRLGDREIEHGLWSVERQIAFALIDGSSQRVGSTGSVGGAFWTSFLAEPVILHTGSHYAVVVEPIGGLPRPHYAYVHPHVASDVGYRYVGYVWRGEFSWSEGPHETGASFVFDTAVVPEPQTVVLLSGGLGILLLIGTMRRRGARGE